MKNLPYLLYLILLFQTSYLASQNSYLKLFVYNQPDNKIVLGTIKGDQFTPVDSANHENGHIGFQLSKNNRPGIYRVILGQTLMAKVMREPPQQLDIIFNGKDIEIETDFNAPLDSIKVIHSVENKIWFDFLLKEKRYQKQKKELVMQINYFQKQTNDPYYAKDKQKEIIDRYNNLQKERTDFIDSVEKEYPGLYVSKLIRLQQEPFLDGNFSEQKRKNMLRSKYFNHIEFTDEALINSSVYTEKAFSYLMLYVQKGLSKDKQVKEFTMAIDTILAKTSTNPKVSAFVVDYLLRGFEKLGLDHLQTHVADNYWVPHGCSDDHDTLKRRLAFLQMKKGDRAPDFTLSDLDGNIFNLYSTGSDYKLIVFWETSCPMCKEILPQLKNWYFAKEIDLEVFAISIDTDKNAWQTFVNKVDYPWINLNEPYKWDGETASAYNLYATPTMFLLNSENRILAKPIDFNSFMEAISNLYSNEPAYQ